MEATTSSPFLPEEILGRARSPVVLADADGRISLANASFLRLTQADPQSILGSSVHLALGLDAQLLRAWMDGEGGEPLQLPGALSGYSLESRSQVSNGQRMTLLTLVDGRERSELIARTKQMAIETTTHQSAAQRVAEAAVLIRHFVSSLTEGSPRAACLQDGAKVAKSLFPEAGAVYDLASGTTEIARWGQCTASDAPSVETCSALGASQCTHTALRCNAIEAEKALWLSPQEPSAVVTLFADAFAHALKCSR